MRIASDRYDHYLSQISQTPQLHVSCNQGANKGTVRLFPAQPFCKELSLASFMWQHYSGLICCTIISMHTNSGHECTGTWTIGIAICVWQTSERPFLLGISMSESNGSVRQGSDRKGIYQESWLVGKGI